MEPASTPDYSQLPLITVALLIVIGIGVAVFLAARQKAVRLSGGNLASLHSRPGHHGLYCLLWTMALGVLVLAVASVVWARLNDAALIATLEAGRAGVLAIESDLILSDVKKIALGEPEFASARDGERMELAAEWSARETWRRVGVLVLSVAAALGVGWYTLGQVTASFRSRNRSERFIQVILIAAAAIAILTTIGIVLSLISETLIFFNNIGWQLHKFFFGLHWSPLSGVSSGTMNPDDVGMVPLFVGTLMITGIAMLVAVPIGLFSAIYLSEFANSSVRAWAKPMLEILAGIPTVVYGFFAAITVAPAIRAAGQAIGLDVASESALAAGVVMGIMIIPFISSLSDDVINAVPQSLRDGSYGLGATRAETIRQVVLPAALPGIMSACLLGVSRAIGETMIVVMAAGQGANLTLNPLEAVTTVTVQIVMLITGDTEATVAAGPAFTLGFTLFCVTLALNIIALRTVRKYRELYD